MIKFSPILLLLLLALSAPAQADRDSRDRRDHRGSRGLGQTITEIEQRTGGKVLSVRQRERDGGRSYSIRILTPSGTVRTLTTDAEPD